ncbi:MAG: hypothetical protein SOR93_02350 [Clostridiales Family XIII bacterium]|uniref:DUF7479 domain-containing protein n=1 Tax=Hominibacterium faecale TaxID=2839743 RepID=UPI0011DE1C4A|nr:hypothetical protein [Hominibacterium faecale]MCI7300958.1 hypothetical protein [Clostridia bacterium]MDE8734407.1 hypothetical protein [Eubacteriales bacterium DFI.9.88]MDY3010092.1 hypothetical protein [Clostridiales Family XIII bacterium]
MTESKKERIFCGKCKVELVLKKTDFQYMRFTFNHQVPVCPVCGQVYLSEELVNEKVKELEKNFEEK